eukprot:m.213541 g.213541  ORF g.213541 m.213541 type:complete len:1869 (-) comp15085_c1_seq1:201-5807(-)
MLRFRGVDETSAVSTSDNPLSSQPSPATQLVQLADRYSSALSLLSPARRTSAATSDAANQLTALWDDIQSLKAAHASELGEAIATKLRELEYACSLNLGQARLTAGDTTGAVAAFENAVAIRHDDLVVWFYLAKALWKLRKLRAARFSIEQALVINKTHYPARLLRCRILAAIPDIAMAKKECVRLLTADPSNKVVLQVLASVSGSAPAKPYHTTAASQMDTTNDSPIHHLVEAKSDSWTDCCEHLTHLLLDTTTALKPILLHALSTEGTLFDAMVKHAKVRGVAEVADDDDHDTGSQANQVAEGHGTQTVDLRGSDRGRDSGSGCGGSASTAQETKTKELKDSSTTETGTLGKEMAQTGTGPISSAAKGSSHTKAVNSSEESGRQLRRSKRKKQEAEQQTEPTLTETDVWSSLVAHYPKEALGWLSDLEAVQSLSDNASQQGCAANSNQNGKGLAFASAHPPKQGKRLHLSTSKRRRGQGAQRVTFCLEPFHPSAEAAALEILSHLLNSEPEKTSADHDQTSHNVWTTLPSPTLHELRNSIAHLAQALSQRQPMLFTPRKVLDDPQLAHIVLGLCEIEADLSLELASAQEVRATAPTIQSKATKKAATVASGMPMTGKPCSGDSAANVASNSVAEQEIPHAKRASKYFQCIFHPAFLDAFPQYATRVDWVRCVQILALLKRHSALDTQQNNDLLLELQHRFKAMRLSLNAHSTTPLFHCKHYPSLDCSVLDSIERQLDVKRKVVSADLAFQQRNVQQALTLLTDLESWHSHLDSREASHLLDIQERMLQSTDTSLLGSVFRQHPAILPASIRSIFGGSSTICPTAVRVAAAHARLSPLSCLLSSTFKNNMLRSRKSIEPVVGLLQRTCNVFIELFSIYLRQKNDPDASSHREAEASVSSDLAEEAASTSQSQSQSHSAAMVAQLLNAQQHLSSFQTIVALVLKYLQDCVQSAQEKGTAPPKSQLLPHLMAVGLAAQLCVSTPLEADATIRTTHDALEQLGFCGRLGRPVTRVGLKYCRLAGSLADTSSILVECLHRLGLDQSKHSPSMEASYSTLSQREVQDILENLEQSNVVPSNTTTLEWFKSVVSKAPYALSPPLSVATVSNFLDSHELQQFEHVCTQLKDGCAAAFQAQHHKITMYLLDALTQDAPLAPSLEGIEMCKAMVCVDPQPLNWIHFAEVSCNFSYSLLADGEDKQALRRGVATYMTLHNFLFTLDDAAALLSASLAFVVAFLEGNKDSELIASNPLEVCFGDNMLLSVYALPLLDRTLELAPATTTTHKDAALLRGLTILHLNNTESALAMFSQLLLAEGKFPTKPVGDRSDQPRLIEAHSAYFACILHAMQDPPPGLSMDMLLTHSHALDDYLPPLPLKARENPILTAFTRYVDALEGDLQVQHRIQLKVVQEFVRVLYLCHYYSCKTRTELATLLLQATPAIPCAASLALMALEPLFKLTDSGSSQRQSKAIWNIWRWAKGRLSGTAVELPGSFRSQTVAATNTLIQCLEQLAVDPPVASLGTDIEALPDALESLLGLCVKFHNGVEQGGYVRASDEKLFCKASLKALASALANADSTLLADSDWRCIETVLRLVVSRPSVVSRTSSDFRTAVADAMAADQEDAKPTLDRVKLFLNSCQHLHLAATKTAAMTDGTTPGNTASPRTSVNDQTCFREALSATLSLVNSLQTQLPHLTVPNASVKALVSATRCVEILCSSSLPQSEHPPSDKGEEERMDNSESTESGVPQQQDALQATQKKSGKKALATTPQLSWNESELCVIRRALSTLPQFRRALIDCLPKLKRTQKPSSGDASAAASQETESLTPAPSSSLDHPIGTTSATTTGATSTSAPTTTSTAIAAEPPAKAARVTQDIS